MRTATNKTITGKLYMVTGATSGIGQAIARALTQRGAAVIIVGRNRQKSEATVRQIREQMGNPSVEYLLADLSAQKDIRQVAQQFMTQYQHLDVLVNNVGGDFLTRQESADGIEMTFALNHLSYFLLTNLLLTALERSPDARIVNVSSSQHQGATMNFDDLNGVKSYSGLRAYQQSKLANVLFTYELARRLEGTNITVNAFNPGTAATQLWTNNGFIGRLVRTWLNLRAQSPEAGAETGIYLATSPEVEGVTGKYLEKKQAIASSPASYDKAAAKRLWQISAEMTGL
jgi:retinol dehydrogenase-12